MKSNIFTSVRFVMALLTVLAIAGKPYIPAKTLSLHPAPTTVGSIYGPLDGTNGPVARWTDHPNNEWRCNYKSTFGYLTCGITLTWNLPDGEGCAPGKGFSACTSAEADADGDGWGWEDGRNCYTAKPEGDVRRLQGRQLLAEELTCANTSLNDDVGGETKKFETIDFSGYDGLKIKISYEGRARFLRLYLRDVNPELALHKDFTSGKFMSAYLRTEDLKAGAAYVPLTDFSVEEWWILLHNPARALVAPEFAHIVAVGIDHIEHGVHKVRVDSVELVGERVSLKEFLMALLLFWTVYLLMEAILSYYYLRSAAHQQVVQINELAENTEDLEKEKDKLRVRSTVDPLTGVFNRSGMTQRLREQFGRESLPEGAGMMVIDIDHFKKINDTYGHDVGDCILRSVASLVMSQVRPGDIFARWGGEEFVLVANSRNKEQLMSIAEKLRVGVASHRFEAELNIQLTISIGATTADQDEAFIATFKRADAALYKAKVIRNTVAYEGRVS